MDSKYIKMHLVVDRYIQGLLPDEEKAELEERLIWDEQLMDELDLAELLQEGLRETARHLAADDTSSGVIDWLTSVLYVPQYAAAASFVLAVAMTSTLLMSIEQTTDFDATQTEIIPLISTRGEDAQTIYVGRDGWAVLLIDEPGSHQSYRVTISADDAVTEPVWTGDLLTATYPEALAVTLPGKLLSEGKYVAALEGILIDDSGDRSHQFVQSIRFEVAVID